jgi:cyclohexyl-isocyanide hydratase
MAQPENFNIVFVLFDNVTQLDFTGPIQFLSRLPGETVHVAAKSMTPIKTDCGFAIMPTVDFANCPQADIICVPGGHGVRDAIGDDEIVAFVRRQSEKAAWITSVCTGSFILGAAGLLNGKQATTHWGYTHLLEKFGATYQHARMVRDGNLITAGGVTSGIDFSLELIGIIAGLDVAQSIQLAMEYDPAPPFSGGTPETSPAAILDAIRANVYDEAAARMATAIDAR